MIHHLIVLLCFVFITGCFRDISRHSIGASFKEICFLASIIALALSYLTHGTNSSPPPCYCTSVKSCLAVCLYLPVIERDRRVTEMSLLLLAYHENNTQNTSAVWTGIVVTGHGSVLKLVETSRCIVCWTVAFMTDFNYTKFLERSNVVLVSLQWLLV
jgi:hypothetical protein